MRSTIPAVLDALKEGLQQRAGLADVTVSTSPLGDVGDSIEITRVEAEQNFAALGARSRDETYTVFGEVWITRPGAGDEGAIEARDQAFDYLAEVEDFLIEDPALTAVDEINTIEFTGGSLRQGTGDRVRVAMVEFQIRVKARLRRD